MKSLVRRNLASLPLAIMVGQLFQSGLVQAQAVGTPLRLFPAMNLDGEMVKPDSIEGKVTLLYVWASWCPFCLQDLPTLRDKQEALRSKGFSILGLNADKDLDAAQAWIKTHKVNFPNIRLTADYKNAYLGQRVVTPSWWIAGRDGLVLDSAIGGGSEFRYRNRADMIEKIVAKA
jgi:thiol-disulfide isomerase/thioredoxin